MAHMYPARPDFSGGGHVAEQRLFDALRDGLDDEYFVYHELRYVHEDTAGEGEADFLVVHRTKGLLNIECKGKGVHRRGNGTWYREKAGGRTEDLGETPYEQAQRTIKDLAAELKHRITRLFPDQRGFPFVHGHAVAFPRTTVADLGLPLDAPLTITLDGSDLSRIAERIDEIYEFWNRAAKGRRVEPFDKRTFKHFRHQVLQPQLHLVPRLAADVAHEGDQFARLTAQQELVAQAALINPRMAVIGGAGTGKTVAALEITRRLANEGKRVLLLCFNRALGRTLGRHFASEEAIANRVDAMHFHSLCYRAFKAMGLEFDVPREPEAAAHFFDKVVPETLFDAIAEEKLKPWDAVVVDEAQDFAASWWPLVEELAGGEGSGHLVVLHDPEQNIFARRDDAVPPMAAQLPLIHNLRNTKHIARAVGQLCERPLEPYPLAPEGEPPTLSESRSAAKNVEAVTEMVTKLIEREGLRPDQITILTPHRRANSSLAGVESLGPYPLADKPGERDGKVLHTTIGAFKGLEADVVIMLDVDPRDERCGRRERYVAASRARHRLFVSARGDWLA